jgi:hypothetical protein
MRICAGDEFIVEELGPDSPVLKRVNLRALMQDIIKKAKHIDMDKLEAEIEEEANRLARKNPRFLIDTNQFVAAGKSSRLLIAPNPLLQPQNHIFELRNIPLDHLPGKLQINLEISMDQNIPHSSNLSPFDLWVISYQIFRQVLHSFANYLYPPDYLVLKLHRDQEIILSSTLSILLYQINRSKNVLKKSRRFLIQG